MALVAGFWSKILHGELWKTLQRIAPNAFSSYAHRALLLANSKHQESVPECTYLAPQHMGLRRVLMALLSRDGSTGTTEAKEQIQAE